MLSSSTTIIINIVGISCKFKWNLVTMVSLTSSMTFADLFKHYMSQIYICKRE